jgi:tRNA A-37 threonylcarbamoyl transferase component Bud32/tetratricopeptide (TPR) repeat protein
MPQLTERLGAALAPEYMLDREIARGGMSHVFLARDVLLEKPVAVKLLRPELASANAVERFLREARILASLSHPNILPVHRAGEADGLFYYITDYMPGETLADHLREGALPPDQALALARDLLAALDLAHRAGVVHRDVKPANIFVQDGRAILADFGIARVADGTRPGEDQEAGAGIAVPALTIAGTPGYMAPEQLRGESTPRTDLYAVGLVIYEALTGRVWQNAPPSDRRRWQGVPRQVVPVLRRALEPDPADRWTDAAAFGTALRPTTRRFGPVAASAVAAVVVLTGVLAMLARPAALEWDIVIAPLVLEEGVPSGFDVASRIAQDLQLVPGLRVPFGNADTERRLAAGHHRRAENEATRRLRTTYLVKGAVRAAGDGYRLQLTVYDRTGAAHRETTVSAASPDSLADAGAFELLKQLSPELSGGRSGWMTGSFHAFRLWLQGERALRNTRWVEAGHLFRAALQADPSFIVAAVRLRDVYDWVPWAQSGPPLDLAALFTRYGHTLEPLDSMLVAARLQPIGRPRLDALHELRQRFPGDPHIASYFADELFHRGAFLGHSLDAAISAFEEATRLDSLFGPAWEHLGWALIRQGTDAQAALRAVAGFARTTRAEPGSLHDPDILRASAAIRFGSPLSEAQWNAFTEVASREGTGEYMLRHAMAFDLPEAQLELARRVAARTTATTTRARALQAAAIALLADGRVADALARLDSVARLTGDPTYALQAAEWRILPRALGWPAASAVEVERGREVLRRAAREPTTAARARWALGMDALSHRDIAAATAWLDSLAAGSDAGSMQPLAYLLAGWIEAERDPGAALALTAPLHDLVTADQLGHPFARSALFLGEARWLEAAGDGAAAARRLLWFQHADVHDLRGPIRPWEVDWIFGASASAQRTRLALQQDDATACIDLAYVRRRWHAADPAIAASLTALERLAGDRCHQ